MEKIEVYGDYDNLGNQRVIKTIDTIDDFIDGILVFRNAPYYEVLSKDDCEEEYSSYVENGIPLGCYINGQIAGLNCILYDSEDKHSILFSDKDKIAYYSGLAVKGEYRKHGIGKLLVRETDLFLQNLKMFDYSYARILLHGSMSEGIFRKYGFEDVYVDGNLIVDEVDYERNTSGVSSKDERKYMVKSLSNKGHGIYHR